MAFYAILKEICDILNLDGLAGYLDDIIIIGDDEVMLRALTLLSDAIPTIGLQLNLKKCELIPTAGTTTECDLTRFPDDIKRLSSGNFKILGIPIGSQVHCAEFTSRKRVDKMKELLTEIQILEDAQIAHKIFMRCLGACRMMHAMRTTRPDWIKEQLRESDVLLRKTFDTRTGLALSENQWRQAGLSLNNGGLGVRDAERHASAAYLASRSATRQLCQELDPHFI